MQQSNHKPILRKHSHQRRCSVWSSPKGFNYPNESWIYSIIIHLYRGLAFGLFHVHRLLKLLKILWNDVLIYLDFHFVFQAHALMRNMLHLRMFWLQFAYDGETVSICFTWPNFEPQQKTESYHLTMDVKLCLNLTNTWRTTDASFRGVVVITSA